MFHIFCCLLSLIFCFCILNVKSCKNWTFELISCQDINMLVWLWQSPQNKIWDQNNFYCWNSSLCCMSMIKCWNVKKSRRKEWLHSKVHTLKQSWRLQSQRIAKWVCWSVVKASTLTYFVILCQIFDIIIMGYKSNARKNNFSKTSQGWTISKMQIVYHNI